MFKPCLGIALTLILFGTTMAVTPPQVYHVKLTQGSSEPEVVSTLENTMGSLVRYERIEEGKFLITCSECFPDEAKISGLREFHFMEGGGKYRIYWNDESSPSGDSLILETYNSSGVLSDNQLSSTEIRIVVFE